MAPESVTPGESPSRRVRDALLVEIARLALVPPWSRVQLPVPEAKPPLASRLVA